jgi:surface antigen
VRSTGRETLGILTATALAACLAPSLGGCSFAIPALTPAPEETTGSIRKIEERLSADLDPEDWRRAKGALALALDPQGNGRPVKWDNPESRMAGEIAALGSPYVEDDEVCRRFRASIDPPSTPAKIVEGHACRLSPDEWAIRDVRRPSKS